MELTEAPLTSESVYDGALLHAYRDTARLPDGSTGVREWIDHPGAAAIVPLLDTGETVLIRQFRYPPRRTFLEVPAGKMDRPDEDPATVAARELSEETGYTAARFTALGAIYPCIGYSNEVIHFFLAEGLEAGTQDLAEGEFVEVERLDFAAAVERARTGQLRDMKTVTALTLAAAHLENSAE
ncbi:NUDIX domain-containing protein [Salisaeta longa]|uniref:NUDIX domain-containing protein n=1 Tax=Salisaeta longa TaxID=503170 RepID=UPI0003B5677D|nr:NUDIX hydrolase [Salisaeta longa]